MTAVLNIPSEKLARHAAAAAGSRVVTLRELLGDRLPALPQIYEALLGGFTERLGIAPEWGVATSLEERLAERLCAEEIGTEEFVAGPDVIAPGEAFASATLARPGGTVRADIRLEGRRRDRIREILLTGDFFVTPPRMILDLEAALRGIETEAAGAAVADFFVGSPGQLLSLAPEDFRSVVETALARR